jgi:peptide deformylase
MPTLLTFVEKSHPILREIMPDVQNFNDPALHEMIENMRYSIIPEQLEKAIGAFAVAAGMAANQWGIKLRVFIFTPDGSHAGKRCEVMINPSYSPYLRANEQAAALMADYEGCFSIPLTAGLVNRYDAIKAIYFTPEGKKIEKIFEGWEARVFQHETDHLNGKLFDGCLDNFPGPHCLERTLFNNTQEMQDYWNNVVRPSREAK